MVGMTTEQWLDKKSRIPSWLLSQFTRNVFDVAGTKSCLFFFFFRSLSLSLRLPSTNTTTTTSHYAGVLQWLVGEVIPQPVVFLQTHGYIKNGSANTTVLYFLYNLVFFGLAAVMYFWAPALQSSFTTSTTTQSTPAAAAAAAATATGPSTWFRLIFYANLGMVYSLVLWTVFRYCLPSNVCPQMFALNSH